MIVFVVAPVLHTVAPEQLFAVRITEPPPQTASPEEVIVNGSKSTDGRFKIFDLILSPQELEQVAEIEPPPPTLIVVPVAPELHFTVPVQPDAVIV